MVWFKVDDTFVMHDKTLAAGNAAVGLWTRAGSWSMQQLTDGFVPNHVLRALGTPKERRSLVESSLWVEVEGGIKFSNWSEWQPTREQVETARQAAADRQRHARERAKSRRDSQRSHGGSHGPPDPTRPDPTNTGTDVPVDQTEAGASVLTDKSVAADRFDEFWNAYDHKVGRKKAETAYRAALRKTGVTEQLLIDSATSYVEWVKSEGKHPTYTKHPTTWLNGEHWRDERVKPQTNVQRHMALVERLASEQHLPQIGESR